MQRCQVCSLQQPMRNSITSPMGLTTHTSDPSRLQVRAAHQVLTQVTAYNLTGCRVKPPPSKRRTDTLRVIASRSNLL